MSESHQGLELEFPFLLLFQSFDTAMEGTTPDEPFQTRVRDKEISRPFLTIDGPEFDEISAFKGSFEGSSGSDDPEQGRVLDEDGGRDRTHPESIVEVPECWGELRPKEF